MTDDSNNVNGLPPKLDLRKKVITPMNSEPASAASVPNTDEPTAPASPSTPSSLQDSADSGTAGPRPLIRPAMGPKTIKLKKPVPLGIKRATPDPAAAPGSKRATSKISLPTDTDALKAAAPATPQPIQIPKRPDEPEAVTESEAAESEESSTPAPVLPPQPAPDPKRQTSRISLESVLGSESQSGPKTIKLKRPGSSTIKPQGMEAPEGTDARRQTSAVELPSDTGGEDNTSTTQKKTIKVKRPSIRTSLRTGTSGGSGGSATGGGGSPTMFAPPTQARTADHAHWFFIATGCAATIITGVLIYVQSAQVLGPNISLTELSYGAPDMELPWPGRITR